MDGSIATSFFKNHTFWRTTEVILYLDKASVQEDDAKYHFTLVKTGYFKRLWRLSRNNHVFRKSSTWSVVFACNSTNHMGADDHVRKNKPKKIPKEKTHTTQYYGISGILKILIIWVDQKNFCLLNFSHSMVKSSEIKNMPSEMLRKKFS